MEYTKENLKTENNLEEILLAVEKLRETFK